jgi:membrane protein DedA with SNARE-associated domain
LIQFILARGPGRGLLYRFGRYIGLTTTRLDAASSKVKKGGALSVSIAILVPGVRGAAIVASGLAHMSLRKFLTGLILGSLLFLGLHFFLGFLGGSLFSIVSHVLPLPWLVLLTIVLLLAIFGLWVIIRRRRKAAQSDVEGTSIELWHEGICPVCLALYAANQLRPSNNGKTLFSDTIQSNQFGKGSLTHGTDV